jgi:hypothetical protein
MLKGILDNYRMVLKHSTNFPKALQVSQPEKSIGDCIHFPIACGSFDSRNENLPFSIITFKGSAHVVCAIMYVTEKVDWKSPWQEEKR